MVYCYWRCCYFLFALKLDLHHMQYYKYAKCTIAFLYYYNGNACVPLWFNLSSLSFFLIFFHLIIGRFVVCMGFFFSTAFCPFTVLLLLYARHSSLLFFYFADLYICNRIFFFFLSSNFAHYCCCWYSNIHFI